MKPQSQIGPHYRYSQRKYLIKHLVFVLSIIFLSYTPIALAQTVTHVVVDQDNGHVSWMANGMQWLADVERAGYLGGDTIPIINVDTSTGNETALPAVPNCYYYGTLADSNWQPLPQTHAFINLCDNNPTYFTGFVSNPNGVYTIEETPDEPGRLVMLLDDPNTPLSSDNEAGGGNNGQKGKIQEPDSLVPRNSTPEKFPSVEVIVGPTYINKFGDPGFVYRIVSTLAFANFIYENSGIRPMNLISINVLTEDINQNGGMGAVRHQLLRLRQSTVQPDSSDISVLMLSDDVDTSYTWGWGFSNNACDLQIAVDQDQEINTQDIGLSSAFIIYLPSLIQRGWILAHELAHLLGAGHNSGDPLTDGTFQNIASLADYVAGCEAKSRIYASCAYDPKFGVVTDFYTCE
ncbi:zinc-dependent metalloprotease family protein [Kaarinaea lacus]